MKVKVKEDIFLVLGDISTLKESFTGFKTTILTNLSEMSGKLQENVEKIAILSSDIRNLAETAP